MSQLSGVSVLTVPLSNSTLGYLLKTKETKVNRKENHLTLCFRLEQRLCSLLDVLRFLQLCAQIQSLCHEIRSPDSFVSFSKQRRNHQKKHLTKDGASKFFSNMTWFICSNGHSSSNFTFFLFKNLSTNFEFQSGWTHGRFCKRLFRIIVTPRIFRRKNVTARTFGQSEQQQTCFLFLSSRFSLQFCKLRIVFRIDRMTMRVEASRKNAVARVENRLDARLQHGIVLVAHLPKTKSLTNIF